MDAEKITLSEVKEMVEKAAITRLRGFNRRYHHWLFLVKDTELVRMEMADKVEPGNVDQSADDCEFCEGEGCRKCGWSGEVPGPAVSQESINRVAQAFRARPHNYNLSASSR
jgi:hypothetical protein